MRYGLLLSVVIVPLLSVANDGVMRQVFANNPDLQSARMTYEADALNLKAEALRDREQTLSSARAAISMISKNSSSALIPEMKSMCTQPSPIRTITTPISAEKRRCLK